MAVMPVGHSHAERTTSLVCKARHSLLQRACYRAPLHNITGQFLWSGLLIYLFCFLLLFSYYILVSRVTKYGGPTRSLFDIFIPHRLRLTSFLLPHPDSLCRLLPPLAASCRLIPPLAASYRLLPSFPPLAASCCLLPPRLASSCLSSPLFSVLYVVPLCP